MMKRSLFRLLPILLLSLSQVVGQIEMVRSEAIVQQQNSDLDRISELIKVLKTGSSSDVSAYDELIGIAQNNPAAVPLFIPLLNDSNSFIRLCAAVALGKIGESSQLAVPL